MYSYNIAKKADRLAFENACTAIEKKVPGIKKEDLLTDVDGTQIQIYSLDDGKIKIVNDYEVDAVYADSDVDISEVL